MGALLALASALSYGVSDVIGGVVARRMHPVRAAFLGQLAALVAVALAATLGTSGPPGVPDLLWGGLSGAGTGLAMAFLFRGMSRGALSVVVPVSAVGGVALPVLVGVTLLGDQPAWLTWLGVVLAIPALWLVSRDSSGGARVGRGSVIDGLVAGVGIAVQYLGLARTDPGAGLWSVLAGRVTALIVVGALAAVLLRRDRSRRGDRWAGPWPVVAAGSAGVLAAAALVAYVTALRTEFVTVAVVLSSLYPLVPIGFGVLVLRERLSRRQTVGLVGALAAAVLISVT